MAEKVRSETVYKGFILQEMLIETSGAIMRANPPSPVTIRQWRVAPIDAKPYQYITAASREAAEKKVDSGEAQRELDRLGR